jgi:hypothetical protein
MSGERAALDANVLFYTVDEVAGERQVRFGFTGFHSMRLWRAPSPVQWTSWS